MLPPIEKFISGEIKTLGWGVLEWCSRWLVNPDSRGGTKGARWVFKDDQVHFILAFYAVDENGDWLYMRSYRERAKGTGKSPMAAAIACAEYLGPTVFSHFDESGSPVGKSNPDSRVWLAGVAWTSTQHTYRYIRGMLNGPAQAEFNLSVGATRIEQRENPNRRIDVITSSSAANEGDTPTFAICEETQHWLPGDHHDDFYETIVQSVAKVSGRLIEVTNTPMPGEGSVAEATHKHYEQILAGEAEDTLLFDTVGFDIPDIYDEDLAIPTLEEVYKDAPWVKPRDIFRQYCQPGYREFKARRFFFNQRITPNALWITEKQWKDARHNAKKLKKSDRIAIGFRFRTSAAAIIAVRLRDGAMFVLKKWERPPEAQRTWEVSYVDVDDEMRKILDKHNVYNVFADDTNMQELVGRWAYDYDGDVIVVSYLVRSKQKWSDSVELFETGILTKRIKHDNDQDLTRHVARCVVEEVPQGRIIRPVVAKAGDQIVFAEAAVLAARAYAQALEDGGDDEGPSNYVYSF